MWVDHSYGVERFKMEVQRLLDVLNKRLASQKYLVSDEDYTIADMAWLPWIMCLDWGYKADQFLELKNNYPHVMRWAAELKARPAVEKGLKINNIFLYGEEWAEYHSE